MNPNDPHHDDPDPEGRPEQDWRLRSITELVTDTVRHGHEQESAFASVYLLAHFDLDCEHYGLVQVWDRFDDEPVWRYSLWYWDANHDLAQHLCDFPDHPWEAGAPWVEAAQAARHHLNARRQRD